jgi:hypothetical protein
LPQFVFSCLFTLLETALRVACSTVKLSVFSPTDGETTV